jgi:hypothetical protein
MIEARWFHFCFKSQEIISTGALESAIGLNNRNDCARPAFKELAPHFLTR